MDALGIDLALVHGFVADEWGARDLRDLPTGRAGVAASAEARDLAVVAGREALGQALVLRLLTPQGSLAALGHAAYGSRLHTLVGRRKGPTTRHLARLYTLEAVAQEPRVGEVVDIRFDDPLTERPDTLGFTLAVRPAAGGDPLSIRIEVSP